MTTGQPSLVLPGSRSPRDPSRALPVGGRGLPRSHVAQVQQERLIDAVVQVVAERGYEHASIKGICRRAGVAFNTFYDFFSSKEELVIAAYQAGVPALLEDARRNYDGRSEPWELQAEKVILCFLENLAANPAYARFLVVEAPRAGSAVRDLIDRDFEVSFRWIDDVRPESGIGDLLPMVVGGIYTRIHFYVRSGMTDRLPELLPSLLRFTTGVFHAEPAAAGPA